LKNDERLSAKESTADKTNKPWKHQWPGMRHIADVQGNQKPNATGKPHRSAKRAGNLQAELVGVGLTAKLGWGEKKQLLRASKPCIDLLGRQPWGKEVPLAPMCTLD